MVNTKFERDTVDKFTPVTFAGEFVRKMRFAPGLANIPSIRTTVSIPRFLTARYFRTYHLDPVDYYQAAVLNTPPEDQHIAKRIANELLFPRAKKTVSRTTKQEKSTVSQSTIAGIDQIMSELTDAGFDDLFDHLDVDLNEVLDQQEEFFDFLDELSQSNDPQDNARLDLLNQLDSEFAIINHNLTERGQVDTYIQQLIAQQAGAWGSDLFQPAINLGMGKQISRQARMPWEIATAMSLMSHPDFSKYIQDLLDQVSPQALGRTMQYLRKNNQSLSTHWENYAFDRIKNMVDYYEMIQGMQSFKPPPVQAIEAGLRDMDQSLQVTDSIDKKYGSRLSSQLFNQFTDQITEPTIDEVQQASYNDGKRTWEKLLDGAVHRFQKYASQSELSQQAKQLHNYHNPRMTDQMKRYQQQLAEELATNNMETITDPSKFLPELDHMIEHGISPELDRTMVAGKGLGIAEEFILERYEFPLKILETYIHQDTRDKSRYNHVVNKLSAIPHDNMKQMMGEAIAKGNSPAMAAMAAIDLHGAIQAAAPYKMPDGGSAQDMISQTLDKSIGGGTNLLKQWFLHRNRLPRRIRDQIKEMMKQILLEIGLDWATRGVGSSEEGIIPVTQTRPYRDGDELDYVDIEATLSSLLMSGKRLEQLTRDELMVTETSKGKTALGVLIDISGSMTDQNLAMCAISVVMLLGKMEAKELAITLFESNCHVIKGFEDVVELDDIANELLDLQSRGGTRADAALRWIGQEFDHVPDAEVKIMYFLSDFYLSENIDQLSLLCEPMILQGVKVLAAYHGRSDHAMMKHMVEIMDGNSMKISDFDTLPMKLQETIVQITD